MILEIGNSRMSVAPASLSAGITVLTSRFSTTDSTAQSPEASFDTVGDLAAGSTFSTAAALLPNWIGLSVVNPAGHLPLRGDGAIVRDEQGVAFMADEHP